jgi:hypothetical protein|tara:strand:+ start:17 stop:487 length:471 start_codon:yes stop_codon:yes gene_type:complete
MALTYRTGSDGKGSALTINELDNNFRYFTGSHPINGDLIITGSITVSGSENSVFDIDTFDLQITGGLDVSRDVAVRDDLTVYDDTNLRKDVNIGYEDANPGFGYTLAVTQSNNVSGSAKFIGGITMENLPTSEPAVSGALWLSGSFDNSKVLMVRD